jgi:hypothetical protein
VHTEGWQVLTELNSLNSTERNAGEAAPLTNGVVPQRQTEWLLVHMHLHTHTDQQHNGGTLNRASGQPLPSAVFQSKSNLCHSQSNSATVKLSNSELTGLSGEFKRPCSSETMQQSLQASQPHTPPTGSTAAHIQSQRPNPGLAVPSATSLTDC